MQPPRLFFFVGKGGVGKSTGSALTALFLSMKHKKSLLVSMDPAHNQRDIFERDFSETPQSISDFLLVKEIDTDYWIRKYLKETERQIRDSYKYQSAFNLQGYYKLLQFSPGLEEYALILAFEDIIRTHGDRDVIVFDMAPTALSLRFFSLPATTRVWLEELLKIRTHIYEKKEIISKIKIGKKEIEKDRVKARLEDMIRSYDRLLQLFISDAARIHLVLNNDILSMSEAVRIRAKLADIGIRIGAVVINKLNRADSTERIRAEFKESEIIMLPLAPGGLTGMQALRAYIEENRAAFEA